MMNDLMTSAKSLEDQLLRDRRALHACAETGFDLDETCRYVSARLEEMGLVPEKCGRSGIIADVGRGEAAVLLRADMDALPMKEQTGLPFASRTEAMHACGHDLHTAMLLGAARLLKAREAALPGRVRLVFQPAEETLSGAKDMLDSGLLAGVSVRGAAMVHVLTGLDIPVGTAIVSSPGVSAPAAATFAIDVKGSGCHGAMPHTGVDPITAGAHILLALQQIQTRETSLRQPMALTIGAFQAGDAPNVIPSTACLMGSARAMDDDTAAFILRRVEEIAAGTARVFRAEAETRILSRCPTLLNDAAVSSAVHRGLTAVLGRERVLLSGEMGGEGAKGAGSEDFAWISHAAPSVMVALAAGRPADGHTHPAHHPQVTFDEAALPVGAAAYAGMALSMLGE